MTDLTPDPTDDRSRRVDRGGRGGRSDAANHGATEAGRDPSPGAAASEEPPRDRLDALLRAWHEESAAAARAMRDELLARAMRIRDSASADEDLHDMGGNSISFGAPQGAIADGWRRRGRPLLRIAASPALRAAALVAVGVLAVAMITLLPLRQATADAAVVLVPDGGRLDAVDRDGNLVGPCPLEHTDVHAEISGFISRVTVTQRYRNTHSEKVEAVYTFPLSHRAAVDRMRMIVRFGGDERIVEGEVKERTLARQIYESARRDGFVASLLEQERPNIFTQSVANIEPGAEVSVEISYMETLQMRDGRFTFDFPMVVGPRYIPGSGSVPSEGGLPAGLTPRRGVILLAPAQVRIGSDSSGLISDAAEVLAMIERAVPIMPPDEEWIRAKAPQSATTRAIFSVRYPDGSEEPGTLRADGTGEVAGRWFFVPPGGSGDRRSAREGTGFARGTDQVPDAGRITPMPVRPPGRSGHDLSMRVSIDTGGPAVTDLRSDLHRVTVREPGVGRATIVLDRGRTIPNRDFVLSWSLADGALAEGVLTQHVPGRDGYFLLYMVPPARVEEATIRPRELIFVLDTSGSMNGFPIEKSKEVMTRMLGAMRAGDTFNIITFSGDHHVLWPEPRPASAENLRIARDFVQSRRGAGGTEMMRAIEAALRPTAPGAPGRTPMRLAIFLTDGYVGNDLAIIDAVRRFAGQTRVFSFGIGDSVNRFLLAEMARAGRGAVDFVLSASDADAAVELFTERVRTPVLTDISIAFEGVETAHVTPPADQLPDLFDREPLVIAGRYTSPGRGTIRIRGTTAEGPWERAIDVTLPVTEGNSTVAAPIWARLQVDDILRPHLGALQSGGVPREIRDMVVRLAEQHRIVSPFTSFVAVERTRVTLGGRPVLVPVPIELAQGVSWEGTFGSAREALEALRGRLAAQRGGEPGPQERQTLAFRADDPLSQRANGERLGRQGQESRDQSRGYGGIERTMNAPARRSDLRGGISGDGASGAGMRIGEHLPPPTRSAAPPAARSAPPRSTVDRRSEQSEAIGAPASEPPGPEAGPAAPGRAAQAPRGAPADPQKALPESTVIPSPPQAREVPPIGGAPQQGEAPSGSRDGGQGRSLDPGAPAVFTAESMSLLSRRVEPSLLLAGFEALAALEADMEGRDQSGMAAAAERRADDVGAVSDRRPRSTPAPTNNGASVEDGRHPAGADRGAADAEPDAKVINARPAQRAPALTATGSLRVVARFTEVDSALEQALAALDIQIEGRNDARAVLVLRVPRSSLVALGLLPQTIRIEPHMEQVRSESGSPQS